MKTLYISDLDGTLLQNNARLSGYAARELNRLIGEGMEFSVATARTSASTLRILREVELRAPLVLMNGVVIYDPVRREPVKVEKLGGEAVTAVLEIIGACGVAGFLYQFREGELVTFYERLDTPVMREFVEQRRKNYGKRFLETVFASRQWEDVIYFTLLDRKERLDEVFARLQGLAGVDCTFYKNTYAEDTWYLEIFSDRASKSRAVRWVREQYGYGQVVGFGDNLNDLPLFSECNIAVAVENAQPEVRERAAQVIGPNTGDAVVRWLAEEWDRVRKG